MACFDALWAVFLSVSSPEKCWISAWSIWWTLKMYLNVMNTLSESWGWQTFYRIVMQAIWCLKFWNMTKSGKQFALSSPLQILGTRLSVPRNLRPWGLGLVHLLFVVDWHEKWKCSLQTMGLGCMQCDVRSMQCPLYAINLIHYTLILFHHYVYLF